MLKFSNSKIFKAITLSGQQIANLVRFTHLAKRRLRGEFAAPSTDENVVDVLAAGQAGLKKRS